MAKILGTHPDGSNCYTPNCKRRGGGINDAITAREQRDASTYAERVTEFIQGHQTTPIDSLNPTGTVFTDYDPTSRAKAETTENIVTLADTHGYAPDTPITVYRGVPKGTQTALAAGDFITTNKQLAQDYAGTGDVISAVVPAGHILNDIDEPDGEEYLYRP